MRTLKYWNMDSEDWEDIEWSAVTSGTVVRCYEQNGTPVPDSTGVYEWTVLKDSYQQLFNGTDLVWTIEIYDVEPTPVKRRSE